MFTLNIHLRSNQFLFSFRLERVVRKSDALKNSRVQIEGEIKNLEVSSNDISGTKKELLNSKKVKEEIFVKANRCKDKIKLLTTSLVGKNRFDFFIPQQVNIYSFAFSRYYKRTCQIFSKYKNDCCKVSDTKGSND